MAGFATEADLRTALDAQNLFMESYYKTTGASGANMNTTSSWRLGTRPAAGADPATTPGTAYNSTAGGIVFPDTSPLRKFLINWHGRTDQASPGGNLIYDRLVGVSGIAMNSTGDKTINSTALTRYTDGVGVEVYLEVTTAGTTTAPTLTMSSYTNQDGTATRAGGAITFPTATLNANALVGPLPLQAGDTGVRSVEKLNVSVAGGGSGVVNVILVKHIATIGAGEPAAQLVRQTTERQSPYPFYPPVRIFDGATLMLMSRHNATSSATLDGTLTVIFG